MLEVGSAILDNVVYALLQKHKWREVVTYENI